MMRIFSILFMAVGVVLLSWGGISWILEDMPLHDLFPHRNRFGSNPLHISYLGIVIVLYAIAEMLLRGGKDISK